VHDGFPERLAGRALSSGDAALIDTFLIFSVHNICSYRCVHMLTEDCEYTDFYAFYVAANDAVL